MNKHVLSASSFTIFSLFFVVSSYAGPVSGLFYGLTTYIIPWTYGINEAKLGKKFIGVEKSFCGFGNISGYKVNMDQFNAEALDTKSYDTSKLSLGLGAPVAIAGITYIPSWIASKILSKPPVRVLRGSLNGMAAGMLISQYDRIKQLIKQDPEMLQEINNIQNIYTELKEEIKKELNGYKNKK